MDKLPYTVDPCKFTRFDELRTVFMRRFWDRQAGFYEQNYRRNVPEIVARDLPGYSRIDFARILAAWTVHDYFNGAFSWKRLGQADPSTVHLDNHPVTDPVLMSEQVKETARMYGADLVGICRVDS